MSSPVVGMLAHVPANSSTSTPKWSASSSGSQSLSPSGFSVKFKDRLTLSEVAIVERAICTIWLLSTIGASAPASYAPLSQVLRLAKSGRAKRRWSVVIGLPAWLVQKATGILSIAGLNAWSAIVLVGPPLFCNPSGSSSGLVLSELEATEKEQLASSEML